MSSTRGAFLNEADLLNMRQSPDSFNLTPRGIEVGKCDFTGTPPASSHRELSGFDRDLRAA